MTRISYRLKSIELNDTASRQFNSENLIRINLTQKPHKKTEEYLLKNVTALQNVNHEFIINDPSNKIEKISMTIRKVIKKPTLANFFNLDNNSNEKKSADHSIDNYIDRKSDNNDDIADCEYIVPMQSLVGYCIVNLKEVKRGVNNTLRLELLSKKNEQIVGYVNVDLYMWDCPVKSKLKINNEKVNDQQIKFVDLGCKVANPM